MELRESSRSMRQRGRCEVNTGIRRTAGGQVLGEMKGGSEQTMMASKGLPSGQRVNGRIVKSELEDSEERRVNKKIVECSSEV